MSPRRYAIRTYGCQMNVHDSEKLANLLVHAGLAAAEAEEEADVLVINTCSIRDKAENRLYSDLGALAAWKAERPGRTLGVGGCVAQQVGDRLLGRFPQIDFVFGTHNLRWVPAMLEAAERGVRGADTAESRSPDRFDLPERHPDAPLVAPHRAFVTVMEGCDMFCSFCIVPTTRGREISRTAASILEEARRLVDRGVGEITLLGQTVNAYGRHDARRGRAEAAGTLAFAELLARLDEIPGLDRIRYTSPHPLFFDAELVAAHGSLASLCPHVHLPLQSGSNRVLEAMRRRYTGERFAEIVAELRAARPDVAITSDIIVGFPGEAEADFEETLDLVRRVALVDSFSFKYSPRPGTTAADMPGAIGAAEAQRRLEALQAVQRAQTLQYHRSRVGETPEVWIEGPSRRGGSQVSGRDPQHRVVNLEAPAARPGTRLRVRIVEATPHSLIGEATAHRAAGSPPRPRPSGENRASGQKIRVAPADETGRNAAAAGPEGPALRVVRIRSEA